MHSVMQGAMFLKNEEHSFTNKKDQVIKFNRVFILDDQNNLHVCGIRKDADLQLPEDSRIEGTAEVYITEVDGKMKKYLTNWY
jgi:hypothetical protein